MLAVALSGTSLELQRKSLLLNFCHYIALPQLILPTMSNARRVIGGDQLNLRTAWKGNAAVTTLQMVEQSQKTSYIPLCSPLDDIEHHRVDFSYFFNLGSGERNFVCMCTQPKYL